MNAQEIIVATSDMLHRWPEVDQFALIGSALYLPEQAQDVDFAIMLKRPLLAHDMLTELEKEGWKMCGEYDTQEGLWYSVRKGDVNLMFTHHRPFYDGYVRAMEVCKYFKLGNKDDRIAVCAMVRDGKPAADFMEPDPFL